DRLADLAELAVDPLRLRVSSGHRTDDQWHREHLAEKSGRHVDLGDVEFGKRVVLQLEALQPGALSPKRDVAADAQLDMLLLPARCPIRRWRDVLLHGRDRFRSRKIRDGGAWCIVHGAWCCGLN